MAIRVDSGLLEYMRRESGDIHVEVRGASDEDVALRGLRRARSEVLRVPHPEQPDEPFASFVSEVEVGPQGPGFSVDMADAEVYEGILEEALERILIALEETGLGAGCLTWPKGTCEQTTAWQRDRERPRLDIADWTGDPPPPEVVENEHSTRPPASFPSQGWSRRAPLPTPRHAMAAAAGADGRIYAVGGETQAPLKTVEVYDPASDSWSRTKPLKLARRGPGVVSGPDRRIYAIGGYGGRRGGITTVEAYDSTAKRWEPVAPMTDRRALNHVGAACGADGRIYALVNGGSENPSPFEVYDPSADSWTSLQPRLAEYEVPLLVIGSDGRIYALDSAWGTEFVKPVRVDAYDPATDQWQPVKPPGQSRWGFAAAADANGRIYIIGGNTHSSVETHVTGGKPPATSKVYDPAQDRWDQVEALPTPRTYATAATTPEGAIHVIGGAALAGPRDPLYGSFETGRPVGDAEIYKP